MRRQDFLPQLYLPIQERIQGGGIGDSLPLSSSGRGRKKLNGGQIRFIVNSS